jgi:hypothetical protein
MAENTPLTIKERMVLKKLDTIITLLTEIYGKMCGENLCPEDFPDDARRLRRSEEDPF